MMITKEDIIKINKMLENGKIVNESSLDFALSSANKSKDWLKQLAYLIRAIICEHTFLDGNKRTVAALILYFFNKNYILYDRELIVKAVINMAKMEKPNIKKIQREIIKCLI